MDDKCAKAFYRSALALLALDRVDEAIDCCIRCLSFDPDNSGMKSVHDRAIKAKQEKEAHERARQERIKQEKKGREILAAAYQVGFLIQVDGPVIYEIQKARNIIDMPKPDGSSNPYLPHWDPDDPSKTTLIVPVFFLYPQYATSDTITEFIETTPFAAHLEMMFPPQAAPPEWDRKGEYIDGKLVIYAMTHRRRLFKVGKNMTLVDVCNAAKAKAGEPKDGLELKDGCLTFVLLPKGTAVEKGWVKDFKANKK
jgi:hypothetical protein